VKLKYFDTEMKIESTVTLMKYSGMMLRFRLWLVIAADVRLFSRKPTLSEPWEEKPGQI
jgi:hypothetical protein